jgi:protocatechuate 3,4-dioxygenase beta subunit
MNSKNLHDGTSRRHFLAALSVGGLFYTTRGAFAQQLVLTPAQTLGPYYPDRLPLDQDNDLLIINDRIAPAIGDVTWVSGRVLDRRGDPIRAALVEIWQADNNGAYIHSRSPIANRDANFQGYGRFLTGSSGEYLFRTVKPGLYPGRTRHIHYQVTLPGGQKLVTQLYVQGEPLNTNDGVLNGIRDTSARSSVIVPFAQVNGSRIGELGAKFDIVLDHTPIDNAAPSRPTLVSMSGIVNAASLQPGVAGAGWVTLFGQGLSSTTRTWTASDIQDGKLPKALDGVSVTINNQPASVHYISPTQINVQAPDATVAGQVQVSVTNASGTSSAVSVEVKPYMPAFFQIAGEYISAVRADGSYLGPTGLIEGATTTPARPGEQIILFGTGFGPTTPNMPAGETVPTPATLATPVTIRIDGVPAEVSFAGLSSPGLYQFNITVPANLEDGDHAVTAEINGTRTEKIARLRVQRQVLGAVAAPSVPAKALGNFEPRSLAALSLPSLS